MKFFSLALLVAICMSLVALVACESYEYIDESDTGDDDCGDDDCSDDDTGDDVSDDDTGDDVSDDDTGDDVSDDDTGDDCGSDSDCKGDRVCINGECVYLPSDDEQPPLCERYISYNDVSPEEMVGLWVQLDADLISVCSLVHDNWNTPLAQSKDGSVTTYFTVKDFSKFNVTNFECTSEEKGQFWLWAALDSCQQLGEYAFFLRADPTTCIIPCFQNNGQGGYDAYLGPGSCDPVCQ